MPTASPSTTDLRGHILFLLGALAALTVLVGTAQVLNPSQAMAERACEEVDCIEEEEEGGSDGGSTSAGGSTNGQSTAGGAPNSQSSSSPSPSPSTSQPNSRQLSPSAQAQLAQNQASFQLAQSDPTLFASEQAEMRALSLDNMTPREVRQMEQLEQQGWFPFFGVHGDQRGELLDMCLISPEEIKSSGRIGPEMRRWCFIPKNLRGAGAAEHPDKN
jgi:hypothetical protein